MARRLVLLICNTKNALTATIFGLAKAMTRVAARRHIHRKDDATFDCATFFCSYFCIEDASEKDDDENRPRRVAVNGVREGCA